MESKKKTNKSTRELKPEARKRIELAVLEIFSKTDFHRATMRQIAKKAGVSFSSIYQYYGSKEKLLFGCVDHWLNELSERMIDHLQGLENLKEKMRKVFWVTLDFHEKNPDVGRILFLTIPHKTWMSDNTYTQSKLISLFINVVKSGQKQGLLNPNVPAEVMLDFMWGFVHRHFAMWIYRDKKKTFNG